MLIERLLKVALLGSEWVLYLLVALSILSFSTMFERWLFFRRRSVNANVLQAELRERLRANDLEGAERLLTQSRSIEAQVALEGLNWRQGGPAAIEDAVDAELARAKKELERGTNLLGTLGNNAPFVGLFGTVLGVIIAFHALGDSGGNANAMGGVMKGIAEALVATGVGLFVALPAVVAYNAIQKRIGEIETAVVALTKLITAYVKLAERSLGQPPAVPDEQHLPAQAAPDQQPNRLEAPQTGAAVAEST
jgi:biopolymer transport protein ExbB/biopolymer transport protein TolQ